MTERSNGSTHNANFLSSLTYFQSPLLTLISSLDASTSDTITVHDIIDAYSTLSIRIRSVSTSLSSVTPDNIAIKTIANCSDALAHCLQRDIRRALGDPLASPSQAQGIPGRQSTQFPEEAVYAALDASALTQHAILTMSILLQVSSLHLLFSEDLLSRLLDDLLVIASSTDLAGFDSEKTSALAASVFYTLRVTPSVMASMKKRALTWVIDLVDCMSPRTDSSKVIHHLLPTYPYVFLPDMVKFLPEIFTHAVAPDSSERMDATLALSGYALALLSGRYPVTNDDLRTKLLAKVKDFIVAQHNKPNQSDTMKSPMLPAYLMRAFKGGAINDEQGPRWAVTMTACLIILSGSSVFDGQGRFRLVLQVAEQLRRGKKGIWDELLACLWKSLIWAFSQILLGDLTFAEAKKSKDGLAANGREVRFGIVRQELRWGAGACLIASLLFASSKLSRQSPADAAVPELSWAILVLKDMVTHASSHVYREGIAILARMVSAVGTSTEQPTAASQLWCPDDVVVKALFQRHVMTAKAPAFSSVIHEANKVDPEAVRPLREEEIQQSWGALFEVWELCARRELQQRDFKILPEVLLQSWQALLLVQTHLTQERGHLTAPQEITDHTVSAVASFLEWTPKLTTDQSPSPVIVQTRVLTVCHQLWSIVRNVFSEVWLSQAATALLTRVLQRSFAASSSVEVKDAWSQLCASLISASAPGLVAHLVAEDEVQRTLHLRRELWTLTARAWSSMDSRPTWQESVDFLVIALRNWSMTDDELAAWDSVLDYAIAQATKSHETTFRVIDSLVDLNGESYKSFGASKIFLHLLSRAQVNSEVSLSMSSSFLQVVGSTLRDLYSDTAEHLSIAIKALGLIRGMINDIPTNTLVPFLSTLADGLSVWVGDENEYLLEQEYNEIVIPFYSDVLNRLRNIPISSDTLQALAHFLYSAFIRIPEPGLGPIAFNEFWLQVYPSLAPLNGAYPEDIKTALQACHDAFGTDLPEDFSLETESQFESQAQDIPTQSHPMLSSDTSVSSSTNGRVQEKQLPIIHDSPTGISNVSSAITSPLRSRLPQSRGATAAASHVSSASRRGKHLSPETAGPSSDFTPSSPTDAVHARRFAAGPSSRVSHEKASRTPERLLKRRKLSSPLTPKDAPGRSSLRTPSPSKRKARAEESSAVTPSRSRWIFDGVEVQSPRSRRSSTPGSSKATPKGSRVKSELLSPEVPSPANAARYSKPPSSDDYDTWEVPICVDDPDEDTDVVPDSQPEGDGEDDDSLVPSFMKPSPSTGKGKGKGKGKGRAQCPHPADDTPPLDVDALDEEGGRHHAGKGKGKQRASPLRMRTAPASFLRSPSPAAEHTTSAPLRRARTAATVRLAELQDMYETLQEDGSQLAVDEMVAATALANRLGALLSEKLSKKLSSGSTASGSGSASTSRKRKGREE